MTSFHFFLFPLSIFSTICLGYKLLSLNQSSVVAFYLGPFSRKLLDHCFKQLFLFFYFLAQTHLLAFHSLQNQVQNFWLGFHSLFRRAQPAFVTVFQLTQQKPSTYYLSNTIKLLIVAIESYIKQLHSYSHRS